MYWLNHIQGVRKVILTHGEDSSREALATRIREEFGMHDIRLPHLNEDMMF